MQSLAQLAQDWRGTMPAAGLMAETKIDGWRALYFRGTDNKPRLWSRNGIPLDGADHILARLIRMEEAADAPIFVDGEVQVDGTLAATKAHFERGWRTRGDAGIFHAFDVLPLAEWKRGGSDTPLYQRKAWLRELWGATEETGDGWTWAEGSRGRVEPEAVRVVEDGWCFDAGDVLTEARRVWATGGEGLMLKDAESPYRRTRNAAWQKVKQENAIKWRDVQIVDTPIAA